MTGEEIEGHVEAVLDEWLDGGRVENGDGTTHRVERLGSGVWRSYDENDVNTKTHWDITVLVREIRT